MDTSSLPVEDVTTTLQNLVKHITPYCIIKSFSKSWIVHYPTICAASTIFEHICKTTTARVRMRSYLVMRVSQLRSTQQNGQPVLVMNYAPPWVLDAVIKCIETSQLPPAESQLSEHVTAARLQHYADVYILVNALQI